MKGLYYLIGILCFTYFTDSKPNGAPQDSCFYMTPRHIHPHTFRRVFPTKAMGLYNITTSADVFRPDRPIRVTLWGPPFKGFMLVAAEEGAKDWPTGIFYSDDGAAKRLSCLGRGDTVTHQNNSYKDSVSVLWYGPENMMSEQIQFIATVVVNLTIYYTNIRSGMLRLDPSLHGGAAAGAGGEGAPPIAATMDPWLSGQSVTQAPTNWWSNLGGAAGRGAAGGSWGNTGGNTGWGGANTGAGMGTGSDPWGSNTAGQWGGANSGAGGWGTQNTGGGGWGSQAPNTGGGGWGTQAQNTGGGGWGAQTQNTGGGWGQNTNTGGWGSGGTGTGSNSGWGGGAPNNNQAGNSRGGSGSTWDSNGGTGTGTGTGNSWSANGDWQQWGQGSVTARSYIQAGATQWQNADGSTSWNNGQKLWNAPGDGRPIWHWNSGKISTTIAPKTTQAPKPTQPAGGSGTSGTAWSANALLNLLQNIGFGGAGTAP